MAALRLYMSSILQRRPAPTINTKGPANFVSSHARDVDFLQSRLDDCEGAVREYCCIAPDNRNKSRCKRVNWSRLLQSSGEVSSEYDGRKRNSSCNLLFLGSIKLCQKICRARDSLIDVHDETMT